MIEIKNKKAYFNYFIEKEIEAGAYLIQTQDTTVRIRVKTAGLYYMTDNDNR